MRYLKKIRRILGSMPFAISLLVLMAAACAVSSFVTQGKTYDWYAAAYGERNAALILALQLDDAYHSGWFVLISAFLCLNLLLCNVMRVPALLRRGKRLRTPGEERLRAGDVKAEGAADPQPFFAALRMGKPAETAGPDGKPALYAARNRAGIWGAWVCHLGVLLLIAGFALGQMTLKQESVYGVPGQTRALGETGLEVTIEDFTVALRPDDTVEQYTSRIRVRDPQSGREEEGTVCVNGPAQLFGWSFTQNSTGYAARVQVLKAGAPLQEEILCAGESLTVADKPELAVIFRAFYPDYVLVPGEGPATRSGQMNRPGYLYAAYYRGQMLGMNVLEQGEELTIDEYTVRFSDPQSYTLLAARRDLFAPVALAGGLVTLLGLLLALYVRPREAWAVREADGWTLYGACAKGGVLFREAFLKAAGEAGAAPAAETTEETTGESGGE